MKRKQFYISLVTSFFLTISIFGSNVRTLPTSIHAPIQITATPRTERQPLNWSQVGPSGISVLTLVAQDTDSLFVGTNNGVYKSVNGGQSWQLRNQGMGPKTVSTLLITGQEKDILFAGTPGSGLFRSNNGGDSWQYWGTHLAFPAHFVTALVASPDSRTIYLATSGEGVFRSTNWGEDWELASDGLDVKVDITALAFVGDENQSLWLGTSDGELFQNVDGRNRWSKIGEGLDSMIFDILAFEDVESRVLYVGTDKGVYQSGDGEKWQPLYTSRPGLQIGRVHTLQNQNNRLWVGGKRGLYISDNEGITWQEKNLGLPEDGLVVTVLTSIGNRIFAGTSGYGVFVSDDGGEHWDERNRGLLNNTLSIGTLCQIEQGNSTLYAGTLGAGIFKSTDQGDTWTPINKGLTEPFINAIAVSGNQKDILFAATLSGIFRLRIGEEQWEPMGLKDIRIQTLAASDKQPDVLIAGTWGEGVFRSIDGGITWEASNNGLSHPFISTIAIDPEHPEFIYAGTWGEGIFSSRDEGRTWQKVENTEIAPRINELVIDHNRNLYVATTVTLSKRTTTGEWIHLRRGEFNTITFDPSDSQIVVAGGAAGGLVFTKDGGKTWNNLRTVDADVVDLVLDPHDKGLLFVATSGRSIFRGKVDLSGQLPSWWLLNHSYSQVLLVASIVILLLPIGVVLVGGLLKIVKRNRTKFSMPLSTSHDILIDNHKKPITRPTVFISYSKKDEEEKDRLLSHLGVLVGADLIDLWSDDRIGAGANWETEINKAITDARVAVLLISANFLTSKFNLENEVPKLLNRRDKENLTIFPVIATACAWNQVEWLANMNIRPRNGNPVWSDGGSHVDRDLATIAEEIADIVRWKI